MANISSFHGKIWFAMCDAGNTSRAMFGKRLEYSVFSFMIKSFNTGEVWEVKNRKITRQK
jgi:hypothetical protein